jgi:hypothetical protein
MRFGSIEIEPPAADSMGVRSLACGVITPDLTVLLDPGCSLGPHGKFKIPHPQEWQQNANLTQKICDFAEKADLLFISHFHRDHYKPDEIDYFYLNSSPEIADHLYRNKKILHKSIDDLGFHQRQRAQEIINIWNSKAKEVTACSFNMETIWAKQNTTIYCPPEFFHSNPETRLGKIQPLIIQYQNDEIWYWADVHGFIHTPDQQRFREYASQCNLQNKNALLIFGGPQDQNIKNDRDLMMLEDFYTRIFPDFACVVIDHHCYREKNLDLWLKSLKTIQHNVKLKNSIFEGPLSYYQILQEDDALSDEVVRISFGEAFRDQLFRQDPPTEAYYRWGYQCLEGDFASFPPLD